VFTEENNTFGWESKLKEKKIILLDERAISDLCKSEYLVLDLDSFFFYFTVIFYFISFTVTHMYIHC
jgi:hypothetical protein